MVPKNLTNDKQLGWELVSINLLDKIPGAPKPSQQHNIITLWNTDISVWSWNQKAENTERIHSLPQTEESKGEPVTVQKHGHDFLWQKRNCPVRICSSRTSVNHMSWSSTAFSWKSEAQKAQHMARQVDVTSRQYISSHCSTSKVNSQKMILLMHSRNASKCGRKK
jgi:hypothetical protein